MRRGLIGLLIMFVFPVAMFSEITTLDLNQAIETALNNNLEIKQLESALEVAKAGVGQAFGDLILPDISLSGSFTYLDKSTVEQQNSFFGLADDLPSGIDLTNAWRDNWSATLNITKPIFAGFALYNNYEIEKKGLELAEKELEDKKKDLQFSVTEDFYYLFLLKENVDLMEYYDEQLAETVDYVTDNYNAGFVSRYDKVQAEANYLNNQSTLRSISNTYEIAKMAFLSTIGFEDDEEIEIMGSLWDATNFPMPDMEREDFLELAYENDIDLVTLENSIEVMEDSRDLAESGRYPSLSAFFSYGLDYSKNYYDDIEGDPARIWEGSWNAGLQLTIPIDDWIPISSTAKSIAEVDATIEQYELLIEQYKKLIKVSVNTYFMQLEQAKTSLQAHKASVDSAELALELANKRFKAGTVSSLDLTTSEVSYQDAWANYLEAAYDYVSALLSLNALIGNTDMLENDN